MQTTASVSQLPVPRFYNPADVKRVRRVEYQKLAAEARAWRQKNSPNITTLPPRNARPAPSEPGTEAKCRPSVTRPIASTDSTPLTADAAFHNDAGVRNWGPTWNYAEIRIECDVSFTAISSDEALSVLVDMMEASRQYQNNIEVIATAKSLMLKTLSVGK